VAWQDTRVPPRPARYGLKGHVDKIKFAVARLIGTTFLIHLTDKSIRAMGAVVLAGRFAGGRTCGYNGPSNSVPWVS
jgi:hypothetical protein